jgi:hypothetical protein
MNLTVLELGKLDASAIVDTLMFCKGYHLGIGIDLKHYLGLFEKTYKPSFRKAYMEMYQDRIKRLSRPITYEESFQHYDAFVFECSLRNGLKFEEGRIKGAEDLEKKVDVISEMAYMMGRIEGRLLGALDAYKKR